MENDPNYYVYFYDNNKKAFESSRLCKQIICKKVPDHGYTYNKMPNDEERWNYFELLDKTHDP